MIAMSQDFYYWKLIHHLIEEDRFRAFTVKSNEKEIWLEQENSKETTVIRIVRRDLNWANEIATDLEKAIRDGESIRREWRARHINVINIYLSSDVPVDSFEELVKSPRLSKNRRIKIESFLLDQEETIHSLNDLSKRLAIQIPMFNKETEMLFEDIQALRDKVIRLAEKRLKQEQRLFTYGKPLFTIIILLNILAIYGAMEYFGSSTSLLTLVEFGAKYDPLIIQGEWWRFFTSTFLHIGLLHLIMNSIALYYLGSAVERIYGTPRFIAIYLFAGFVGALSSFVFNSQISAGASGAIFGCFGALLYFGIIHRKLFFRTMGKNVIVILILNLAFGFMIPMVDNGAHIGGLIGGFLASACLHLPKHSFKKAQIASLFVTTLAIGSLFFWGYSMKAPNERTYLINVQIAQEMLQRGEIERAYPLLKEAVQKEVDIVEANFLLAYCEARLGLLKEAEKNLLITLEQRPFLHEAHFNLSLVYYELRQFLDAYYSAQSALELKPDNEDYRKLKETIDKQLDQIKKNM